MRSGSDMVSILESHVVVVLLGGVKEGPRVVDGDIIARTRGVRAITGSDGFLCNAHDDS